MAKGMISSSYRHHGKRVKLSVTFEDEGPESWQAAQAELEAMLRERRRAAAARTVPQAFRKKKAPKKGGSS